MWRWRRRRHRLTPGQLLPRRGTQTLQLSCVERILANLTVLRVEGDMRHVVMHVDEDGVVAKDEAIDRMGERPALSAHGPHELREAAPVDA
eukprot:199413-Prymnesium_polylepis.1